MEDVFCYHLKNSIDDEMREAPLYTQTYIGEAGDFVELDGIGYIITDYTHETYSYTDDYYFEGE